MKKSINSKLIFILGMLMLVCTLAIPMPAQAATKTAKGISISSKTKKVTVKKTKTNRYKVTVRSDVKTATLVAKVGNKNVTKKCKWKSSDKKVLTVKGNKLTVRKAGKCKVTVTYKNRKTILDVTVMEKPQTTKPEKPKKPTPTETQACDHTWEKHWTVFEEEGDCPEGTFMGFCYCGLFTDEEKFHQHLWILQTQAALCTSKERMCGLHGSEVKSECDSYSNPDGSEHYKLRTEYIDYMYCTKCGERVTNRF